MKKLFSITILVLLINFTLTALCQASNDKPNLLKIYDSSQFGFVTDSAVNGDFAYIVGEKGLAVIDISRPSTPKLVKGIISNEPFNDIFIDGKFAYVTAGKIRRWKGKLRIFDISNPRFIHEINNNLTLPESPVGIIVKDGIAYVGDFASGLFLIDVKNPKNPEIISRFELEHLPNIKVVNSLTHLAAKNPKLFIKKYGAQYGFNTPKETKQWIDHSFGTKAHLWWLDIKYPYAFLGCDGAGLYIVNIQDQFNPVKVAVFNKKAPNGNDYFFNDIAIKDNYAFITIDYAGMLVLDISDINNPKEAAHVNPWTNAKWGTSPGHMIQIEIVNNFAYLGAGEDGLYVYDITNPRRPVLAQKLPSSAKTRKGCGWGVFANDSLVNIGYSSCNAKTPIHGAFEIYKILNK